MGLTNVSTAARNAMCNAFADQIDVGTTNPGGKLRIYTTGFATLLAEMDFSPVAYGSAVTGVATANPIASELAAPASGEARVCRILDKDLATVVDGTVTATGGGGDVELNTTAIAIDDIVAVTLATLTVPSTA